MKITWPSVTQRILKRYFHGRRWYGTAYNSAYRYYADNPNTKELDQTAFDKYLKGTNRTNPNDPKENVTDSAAGGTAFATGHKTYNGAISVDNNKSH